MKSAKAARPAYCLALLAALLSPSLQAQTPFRLPVVELRAGEHRIQAEVASTGPQRAQGLMYRDSLPAGHGMLFVFPMPGRHCFWMKNTRIPLSIAFIDDEGTIIGLADMAPRQERSHCPPAAVRYALEMTQGWFESRHIHPGDRIQPLPRP